MTATTDDFPTYTAELPTATDVLAHLGWEATDRNTVLVAAHLAHVEQLARGYTRGRGFEKFATLRFLADDLRAVIIGACARSVSNPTNAYRLEAGTVVATPARFEGWTIAEQMVLNRYRVRVA